MTWWMGWLLVWFGLIVLVVGMIAAISETQRRRAVRARNRRRAARGGYLEGELYEARFGETPAGQARKKIEGPQW